MEEVYLGNERVRLHSLYFLPVAIFLAPLDHPWICILVACGRMARNQSQALDLNQLALVLLNREALCVALFLSLLHAHLPELPRTWRAK